MRVSLFDFGLIVGAEGVAMQAMIGCVMLRCGALSQNRYLGVARIETLY
jgi:hypothetical protein